MDLLYISNTGVIELQGLTNEITGELVDDATVVATLYYCGVEVGGQSWPVTMDHVVDSPETATYRGLLESDLELTNARQYTATVTALSGSLTGTWTCKVVARVRPCE